MLGSISGISSILGLVITPTVFAYLIEHYPVRITFTLAAIIVLAGRMATLFLFKKQRTSTMPSVNSIWADVEKGPP
ncbi:hypothetical protein SY88_17605 [Clostridiales bacterium PH28_bin88]|nr:hypothetical protein SY88_17605 [Clostridiales bacterium PH28_bin88]